METVKKTEKIERIIRRVDRLPTLPVIYSKVTQLLQSPNTTVQMIGNIIAEDQAIAVKVLRLVNSAFYSLPHRIGNLKHAIVLLGLNQIKNLVLATSTLQMFKKYQSAQLFDMRKFWEHSVGCAVAAKVLAETAYLGSPDDMFAGGLLHDVGKLIHAIYLHEEFSAVVSDVEARGLPLFESEKKILGYDHTYTGRELAMRWSLSQGTISMIAHHHLSDGSALLSKEVAAVHIGNSICIAMGLGSGGEKKVPMINEKAWEMLGIELSSLEYIVARIEKLFKESIAILEP